MTWSTKAQPFGVNRAPLLTGTASDGSGESIPVAVDPDTGAILTEGGGGSGGGTSSDFGAAFPATGTAVGASNGTDMEPLNVDGSGYLEVNVETSALPTGASTSANQTNGAQQTKVTDGTNIMSVVSGSYGNPGLVLQPHDTQAIIDGSSNSLTKQVDENYNQIAYLGQNMIFNGSSWDRQRSGEAAANTSGTGLTGSAPLALTATALPGAATATNYAPVMADKFGRQIVLSQAPRDLVGMQSTTITASTSATTVVTGVSNIFADITSITFANTSATATEVTLSDGTNIYTYYLPAGDMRGAVYQVPLAATTVATNWQATTITSVSSVIVTVQYIKNR